MFIEKANSLKKDGRTCTPTMITRSVGLQVSDVNLVSFCWIVMRGLELIAYVLIVKNFSSIQTSRLIPSLSPLNKNTDSKPSSSTSFDLGKPAASTSRVPAANTSESSIIGKNNSTLSKGLSKSPSSLVPVQCSSIIDLTDKEDKSECLYAL